ncbi:L,D-transpeptidase family protein [Lentilactobacillus sp. Marseille-Q4993]|uniref:L,D-transpeptidase family protein n=1 Tax=Lentilactobacillus sp. Marseille-Q4993 TaxID=3039492 RepID=UPI0024BC02C7|nr:L,D-transpeptidase family protein [Lentilactobacillus sp. Marseille-Q4993]
MSRKEEVRKRRRRSRIISGITAGVAVVAIGILGSTLYYNSHFKMTSIDGVNVSGMTVAQATEKLNDDAVKAKPNYIVLKSSQVKVDKDNVEQLFSTRNSMSMMTKQQFDAGNVISKKQQKYRLTKILPKFKNKIDKINASREQTVNSTVNLVNGKAVVKDGKQGTELDKQWMVKQFKKQAKSELVISVPKKQKEYDKPNSKAVKHQHVKLNNLLDNTVKVKTPTTTWTFKARNYVTDAKQLQNGTYQFGSTKVAARVKALAKKADTKGKPVTIRTHNKRKVKVPGGTYGWEINQGLFTRNIVANLQSGRSKTMNLKHYVQGTGYGKKGVGKTYVAVDLKNLREYVYVNGKLKVKVPVMSGTLSGGNSTPTGAYYIMYKDRNATLRGKNDDGSKYASPVNYWEPITMSGVGLHDSPWQPSYVYGNPSYRAHYHSHGCINNPPSLMKKVWANTKAYEPVVIYY